MRETDTTVVVTSCGRYDLLARTLASFRTYNTDPGVARILVVEDGDGDPSYICRQFNAALIGSGRRIGQIAAIDLAYSKVETPYIFHLEDDWEFYRSGFIERSRAVLESDPLILQVWIRAWNDTNGHPLAWCAEDRTSGVVAKNYGGVWNGFSFNPGLRRLSDYKRLGNYSAQKRVTPIEGRIPSVALCYEAEASIFYGKLGYRAVILDETGYLRHIGDGRHIVHPDDYTANLLPEELERYSRNAACPCGSQKKFKHCHGRLG